MFKIYIMRKPLLFVVAAITCEGEPRRKGHNALTTTHMRIGGAYTCKWKSATV
jgi:hypothetical protein